MENERCFYIFFFSFSLCYFLLHKGHSATQLLLLLFFSLLLSMLSDCKMYYLRAIRCNFLRPTPHAVNYFTDTCILIDICRFISQGILIRSWKKRHFKAVKGKLYYYEVSKFDKKSHWSYKCSYVMNEAKAVPLCLFFVFKQDHRVLEPLGFINLANCSVRWIHPLSPNWSTCKLSRLNRYYFL